MTSGNASVVVTGADGFIGRALCAHFADTGRAYRAVVRHHAPGHMPRPNVVAVADLATAPDAELDALVDGAAAVVHLAGRAHVRARGTQDLDALYRPANVEATERLARAAVRVRVPRFVFASSVKVNGEASPRGRAFQPDDLPAPHDAYARSKLDAERALVAVCGGTPTIPIVLRLPLVYGPGVKANFLALLDEVARGRRLPLAAIDNRRSLLYVRNLAEAIDAVLDTAPPPSGVHFVADAEAASVPDLVRGMAAALDVAPHLSSIPVPLLEIAARLAGRRTMMDRLTGSLVVDTTSLRAATGWRPRHTLAEGLAATAAWWRARHSI
jgi:nucleoside-diphosphate-sugar epimerase